MKVIRVKANIIKKISKEVSKGLWKSWEVGFGAEADLTDGDDWKECINVLDTDLKEKVNSALIPKGGGSNQTSNVGDPAGSGNNALTNSTDESFGTTATLAKQYES